MQEAPQSASATAAIEPPLFAIPPYRRRNFESGVGERLRESAANGVSEAEVLASIRTERTALAAAIESETFRDAFARAYEHAHNAVMPAAPVSVENSRAATDDIIANRANDARQLARLTSDADFIAAAKARMHDAPRTTYELPSEKITEMVDRFTAAVPPHGVDARIHAQQAMEGHRIGHLVLAQVFADKGPLHALLKQELAKQLHDDATAERVASDWLEARRQPAIATAETLGEKGNVYRDVMQRVSAARGNTPINTVLAARNVAATPIVASALPYMQQLSSTTALTPRERERSKDQMEKASEWAYTMNHALSCGLTDIFIQPFVGKWVSDAMHNGTMPKGLHWVQNIFEKHDHDHGHHDDHHVHGPGCGHDHHDHDHKPTLKNNLSHWIGGEIAGDVGAVPLTVLVQRMFPGFMNFLRNALEPVAGGLFRNGANRDAQNWAKNQPGEVTNEQIAAKAEELYKYEIDHLPQAVVWNAFSIPINLMAQRRMGSNLSWGEMAVGKVFGAAVSNTMLIGGRAMVPDTFHKWDQWNSRTIVVPITKSVGSIFGADTSKVDTIAREHQKLQPAGGWSERVAAAETEAALNPAAAR